ncbi:hypothetical protein GQ55_5G185000 [Panicum hallii var. hallii]|uniref:Uncharacterized protein n=1 Tax=Panicum hallii var. hallii TaxID=1504633 RepID=A0A2T7DHQ6_9POAL|nr:hypothetical protein GQ55_5G185000 [Panicum hallii var. hallii]
MARRRRTGRKTLRDGLGAAARRTSTRQIWRRATRPSWSPASSHPRCRAGLEALRAASTGPPRARASCWPPHRLARRLHQSDGPAATPAHPRRQTFRPPHLLARCLPHQMARPPVPPTTWVGAAVDVLVGRRNLGLGERSSARSLGCA